jgi:hypothetical protein
MVHYLYESTTDLFRERKRDKLKEIYSKNIFLDLLVNL